MSLDSGKLVRYLLHDLSAPERLELESYLFENDDFAEEIIAAEDELIDSYVAGQLSDRQKESFEKHFLQSEERRKKVVFAQGLMRYSLFPASTQAPEATSQSRPFPISSQSALVVRILGV